MLLHSELKQKAFNKEQALYKHVFNIDKDWLNKSDKVVVSVYTNEHGLIKYIERPFKPEDLTEGVNMINLSSPLALPAGSYNFKVDYVKED